MTKPFYSDNDIEALKSIEYLQAYCEAELGQPRREGGKPRYECAFCSHNRPKMELRDNGGKACAVCVSSGTHGDIFKVAQERHGFSFVQAVEHVAQVVGYSLTPQSDGKQGFTRNTRKHKPTSPHDDKGHKQRATMAAGAAEAHAVEFLNPDMQRRAGQAVKRALAHPEEMAKHAALLGLPDEALSSHLMKESAPLGMLGLDERMRLCYLTLATDEQGQYKATGFKVRSRPQDIQAGAQRFYMYGKKSMLWGAAALATHKAAEGKAAEGKAAEDKPRIIIITEGESDCLAVRYSLACVLDDLSHNAPEQYPALAAIPLVMARPDASTFSPAWAQEMAGLDVILTIDNDQTGEKSAGRVASTLYAAGVHKVWTWHAGDGKKDPRSAFQHHAPHKLLGDIFQNKQPLPEQQ